MLKMRDSEEFKLVTRRKKRIPCNRTNRNLSSSYINDDDGADLNINYESLFRKLLEAEVELKYSSFGDNVFHCLKDSLTALNASGISDILCYGLGHFSSCRSSKYQLAFLLSLKKHYDSQIYVYDPIFSSIEIKLLNELCCNVIKINEEGKRIIHDNITLVYMPHCSVHLINNFLYANWCKKLTKCILLTNSFSIVVDNLKKINGSTLTDYVLRIQPYVTEIVLRNDFMYEEAFNDLNIHIFLDQNINAIPESFWNIREIPCYQDTEIDYITAKQTEEIDVELHISAWCINVFNRILTNYITRKMKPNVKLLRLLIQEIRRISSEKEVKNNIMIQYIFEQARSHRETSEVLCKAREELENLAETYFCYLNSQRVCKEIRAQYAGKGERSIKETADLVGFQLPYDPK